MRILIRITILLCFALSAQAELTQAQKDWITSSSIKDTTRFVKWANKKPLLSVGIVTNYGAKSATQYAIETNLRARVKATVNLDPPLDRDQMILAFKIAQGSIASQAERDALQELVIDLVVNKDLIYSPSFGEVSNAYTSIERVYDQSPAESVGIDNVTAEMVEGARL